LNTHGQLGDGKNNNRFLPVKIMDDGIKPPKASTFSNNSHNTSTNTNISTNNNALLKMNKVNTTMLETAKNSLKKVLQ